MKKYTSTTKCNHEYTEEVYCQNCRYYHLKCTECEAIESCEDAETRQTE